MYKWMLEKQELMSVSIIVQRQEDWYIVWK